MVLAKLVQRILQTEYVDMAEHNMEAERRRAQLEAIGTPMQGTGRTSRRKISDLLSWL